MNDMIGLRVLTVSSPDVATDWTVAAQQSRKWGVEGIIIHESNSHGTCYEVDHGDGTHGWYEIHELRVLCD